MLEPLDYLQSLPCVPLSNAATARFESAKETGIYAICISGTNTSDSKIYVGSAAQSFAKRMILHRWSLKCGNHHSKGLQAVFNTYGFDYLYFRLLEQVDRIDGESKEDFRDRIIAREQFWIDAVPNEIRLNGSPTAGNSSGIKMRPEVREKHGFRVRLALAKPETKAKHSESTKRMWLDPEYRRRISAARVLQWQCSEYRAKFREAAKKSYENNPERIEVLRISGRRNWEDPELRALMTQKNKENCNRPEVKALISKSSKERWADPEWGDRQRDILRKTIDTEEYRQKLKDGQSKFKQTENYQNHIKERGDRTKNRECSKNQARIIISPTFDVYVTDSLNQFAKDYIGDKNGSGLTSSASGKQVTHKGWRAYVLDSWLDVPSFAQHHIHVEHDGLVEYVPFTDDEKQKFITNEQKLRDDLEQKAYDLWFKNRIVDLGTKSSPCILVSPDGTKYVTDVPTQFADTQGYKGRHTKDRFTALVNGKCLSHLNWTGYKLISWADVPNEAIRVLWGDHPDLPPQTKSNQPITPIQLSLAI